MAETLTTLFKAGADPAAIARHLDALDEQQRLEQVRAFPGGLQSKLYDLVDHRQPIDIERFIPTPDATVVYSGKNSAPAFKNFSKLFWRPSGGGEVVGYNEQFWRFASGPGYFVAYDDGKSGEVVFDYTKLPSSKPEGWPEIKPNTGLIAAPAFANMLDYNRAVSSNTIVGRAFKSGKLIAHYLVTRVSRPS